MKRVRHDEQRRVAGEITSERIFDELRGRNLSQELMRLLTLVPLVQVAWSGGAVTKRERKLITDLAELRGIRYGSPGYVTLCSWLDEAPPDRLFEGALAAIRASLDEAPERAGELAMRTLVMQCTQVATASRETPTQRDRISDEEQQALEGILSALDGEPARYAIR